VSTKLPNALIVCDSNREYGSGHVMRSITLGISLQKVGLKVALACFEIPDALIERAEGFGIQVLKRNAYQAEIAVAAEVIESTDPGDVVVFDGYFFDQQAIAEVHRSERFVVVIDDNGDLAECGSSLILNQNLHANEEMYGRNSSCPKLLLGCEWALIRPEVLAARDSQNLQERQGIFIAMGGTDPLGITPEISSRLIKQTGIKVVAAGGFLGQSSLNPTEMAAEMAHSQIGVIACGTTTWEALCLGLPLVGVVIADNQIQVAQSLQENYLGDFIDCRNEVDIESILNATTALLKNSLRSEEISSKARAIVDGRGAHRVALEILSAVS
jgi:spore coat polysaccharide biosynthesis predicted glycosyltransferase SpsG